MENNINKSSPEYSYYHKVAAFFESDPDIKVSDIENYTFTIVVYDDKKYEILKKALYIPQYPGNRLKVNIIRNGELESRVSDEEMVYLLKDNEYFADYAKDTKKSGENNGLRPLMTYILMRPKVVQFYDDIFNNPYGRATYTAEALAKELFHGCKCNITSDLV